MNKLPRCLRESRIVQKTGTRQTMGPDAWKNKGTRARNSTFTCHIEFPFLDLERPQQHSTIPIDVRRNAKRRNVLRCTVLYMYGTYDEVRESDRSLGLRLDKAFWEPIGGLCEGDCLGRTSAHGMSPYLW